MPRTASGRRQTPVVGWCLEVAMTWFWSIQYHIITGRGVLCVAGCGIIILILLTGDK